MQQVWSRLPGSSGSCYLMRVAAALLLVGLCCGCTVEPSDGDGARLVPSAGAPGSDSPQATAPSDESEAAPKVGTRQNPLPLGTAAAVGSWNLKVTSVNLNAAAEVAKENQFNDPPPPGATFIMIGLAATRTGDESGTFWVDMTTKFLGSQGNTFDDSCGVIPKDISDEGETFPGANVAGNLCFAVPSNQIAGGSLLVESSFSLSNGDRTFFALK